MDSDYEMEDNQSDIVDDDQSSDSGDPKANRRTSKYMTKYERARLLGTRALQIRFLNHKKFTNIFQSIYQPFI